MPQRGGGGVRRHRGEWMMGEGGRSASARGAGLIWNQAWERVLGGNGANDHAKLKSENGLVKLNQKVVTDVDLDFLCERRNKPNRKTGSSESGPKTKLNSLDFERKFQSEGAALSPGEQVITKFLVRNPKYEDRNLKTETRNMKYEPRYPKPQTRNLKPET